MYLLDTTTQIITALVGLYVMTVPVGCLFLDLLGFRLKPRLLIIPLGLLAGMLILPLVFTVAAFNGSLPLYTRMALWVGLVAALWAARRWIKIRRPEPITLFDARWQHEMLAAICLIAAAVTMVPLTVHDWPSEHDPLVRSRISVADWSKHQMVAYALVNSDRLPPPDPFLAAEPQLRYYYFSYIPSAMIYHLTGGWVSSTSGLIAQAILIAACLPVLLYVYAREIGLNPGPALFSTFMIALVSGLDIIYMVYFYNLDGYWPGHIDSWSRHDWRRINSISDMLIWTPQHVMGLAGFVLALWLIRRLSQHEQPVKYHLLIICATGVVIAALNGTSSFVWFALVVSLALVILVEAFRTRHSRHPFTLPMLLLSALSLSVLLSVPHLAIIGARRESPFAIAISPHRPGLEFGSIFSTLLGKSPLTYTLDFPLVMTIEMGAVMLTGAAGWWIIRRQWKTSVEARAWTVMLVVFFFIVLAVRPARPDSNNFAARVAPMAWVLLGITSGVWWSQRAHHLLWKWRLARLTLIVFIGMGLAATFYEPLMLRAYPVYARRTNYEMYAWLNQHLARDAVYQVTINFIGDSVYFVERGVGVAGPLESELYTADPWLYRRTLNIIERGYASADAQAAADAFRAASVDYVVVGRDVDVFNSTLDAQFSEYFRRVFQNELFDVYQVPPSG